MAGRESRDRLRVTLVFTAFEAGMPIAGMLVGRAAGAFLGTWAGYGGGAFLFRGGPRLFRAGPHESAGDGRPPPPAHTGRPGPPHPPARRSPPAAAGVPGG